ncbi:MAG: imidazole glycerol phosphate synthase subunit HisH [Candidatus Afipia apatlaquensis]|uniref:Imidazole glycerol phosphate synthase subunit HisH n=1 Tax=Candidatus Afipia apatlaquensis TaxID=2712852 RepID=A0A7C9RI02_9BRAD|nr:imidazole glycerol phosphate synthase subunit HisH [Candidatus Afipia apatlaquensis]
MIGIVDYEMGNLRSVQKALESFGTEVVITSDKSEALKCSGIIIPGVGAFPDAMENLKAKGLDEVISEVASHKVPILGICLGMQLLFERGEEVRECSGLGLIPGSIKKIQGNVKIPHMGWNSLEKSKDCSILQNIPDESYVYFVHSYYAAGVRNENLNAASFYGVKIPAVVSCENVYGVQFHPEKSGDTGIAILKNFARLAGDLKD